MLVPGSRKPNGSAQNIVSNFLSVGMLSKTSPLKASNRSAISAVVALSLAFSVANGLMSVATICIFGLVSPTIQLLIPAPQPTSQKSDCPFVTSSITLENQVVESNALALKTAGWI